MYASAAKIAAAKLARLSTSRFRINGRSGREQLGDWRKVELDAARKIAKTKFAQIQLGQDPAAERLAAKVALKAARRSMH